MALTLRLRRPVALPLAAPAAPQALLVLQARTIFANLEQGVEAKREDLIEAFGTDNEEAVCVEVLNKGEFQVERPCPAPWSSAAALPIRAACPVEPSSRLESTAAL